LRTTIPWRSSTRDLERGSFYELLRDRFGVKIGGGTQTVEPTVTDGDESKLLGVPLHSPALLFTRTLRSSGDEVVEYTTSVYRGDRYKLVSELAGDS
jgi:GntR family transcriptional regulator